VNVGLLPSAARIDNCPSTQLDVSGPLRHKGIAEVFGQAGFEPIYLQPYPVEHYSDRIIARLRKGGTRLKATSGSSIDRIGF
jgi:hypothetical protein